MLSRQLPSQQCTDVTAPTNGKYATRTVVPECECRGTGCNAVVPVGRGTCAAGTSMTEHRQVAKDRTVVEPGPASKVSSSMPTSCHPRPWAESSCRTRLPSRGQGVTSNGPVAGSAHGERRQLDEALDEPMGNHNGMTRRAARSIMRTERAQRLGHRIAVSPGRVDDQEMTENHNQIVGTRTVNAPAQDIFDVLTDPARHRELDGSGFIRSDQQAQRITGTGQVFTMNM